MSEILRNVERVPQPSPGRNPGGDCFACAMTAAVRALYPENPPTFDTVFEAFIRKREGCEPHVGHCWGDLRDAPYRLRDAGYELEVIHDLIVPQFDVSVWSHAWWQFFPTNTWGWRLEAWLSAGWLALVEINYAGSYSLTPDGKLNCIDHVVLLDGQRDWWKPCLDANGVRLGAAQSHETHVVCSARGSYWIDTDELLRKHGAAGLTLIRRATRSEESRAA